MYTPSRDGKSECESLTAANLFCVSSFFFSRSFVSLYRRGFRDFDIEIYWKGIFTYGFRAARVARWRFWVKLQSRLFSTAVVNPNFRLSWSRGSVDKNSSGLWTADSG